MVMTLQVATDWDLITTLTEMSSDVKVFIVKILQHPKSQAPLHGVFLHIILCDGCNKTISGFRYNCTSKHAHCVAKCHGKHGRKYKPSDVNNDESDTDDCEAHHLLKGFIFKERNDSSDDQDHLIQNIRKNQKQSKSLDVLCKNKATLKTQPSTPIRPVPNAADNVKTTSENDNISMKVNVTPAFPSFELLNITERNTNISNNSNEKFDATSNQPPWTSVASPTQQLPSNVSEAPPNADVVDVVDPTIAERLVTLYKVGFFDLDTFNMYMSLRNPSFTKSCEIEINNAISNSVGRSTDIIIQRGETILSRHDFRTFHNGKCFTYKIIEVYMDLIMTRGFKEEYSSVFALKSHFYRHLCEKNYTALEWLNHVNLFSYDIVVIPIVIGEAWSLVVIDCRKSMITHYDSMGSLDRYCIFEIAQFIYVTGLYHKDDSFLDWRFQRSEIISRHGYSFDTGVDICFIAESYSRNASVKMQSGQMTYVRRKIALEILHNQLLVP
ncbi:hypothetical protein FQA39_LY00287 [Lamprigera yunnana]|nr:hypothetical protein FQA39_LY00287 [Lamprigera yunnana]